MKYWTFEVIKHWRIAPIFFYPSDEAYSVSPAVSYRNYTLGCSLKITDIAASFRYRCSLEEVLGCEAGFGAAFFKNLIENKVLHAALVSNRVRRKPTFNLVRTFDLQIRSTSDRTISRFYWRKYAPVSSGRTNPNVASASKPVNCIKFCTIYQYILIYNVRTEYYFHELNTTSEIN